MSYNKYIFFSICLIIQSFISGSHPGTHKKYGTNSYSPAQNYQELRKKSNYQELENKFGNTALVNTLNDYECNLSTKNYVSTIWNTLADTVIGTDCVEGKRRHFLVSLMLHSETHLEGLQTLYACFNAPQEERNKIVTPNGSVYMQIHADQYNKAMEVSEHIRNTMFGNKARQANPLVLVDKVDSRINTALKWALFKVAAVMVPMISYAYKKEKKKESEKEKNKTINSVLFLADVFQTIEEIASQELEKNYPILKTHEVKSLIGEKTWWLYDRKNWIAMAGLGTMGLIFWAVMYDKIPHIYQPPRVIIFDSGNFCNISVGGGSTFMRL